MRTAQVSTDDGLSFSKPKLGLRSHGGTTANNLLPGNSAHDGVTGSVWLNPNAPPSSRYHAQACDGSSGEIVLSVSADGLRWAERSRWNFQGNCDSRTQIFWDEAVRKYVMITRDWYFSRGESGKPPDVLPPVWAQPSFRRVRRLEAETLESTSPLIEPPAFTPLEVGRCATNYSLPRDGSALWRQMFLGPGASSSGPGGCNASVAIPTATC